MGRTRRCRQCEHDLVVSEEPERAKAVNGFELVVAPHHFLTCPSGHERALVDGEYPLRCQEWLIDDDLLGHLMDGRRAAGLCRCDQASIGATAHTEERRQVVEHDVGGSRRHATVVFRFPVATCDGCGRFRPLVDEDFVACWAAITEP